MIRILAVLALSTAFAAPVLAEGMAGDMACSAFSVLDKDGMMAAMEAAKMAPDAMAPEEGMMGAGGAMASGDAMASDNAMASEGGVMGQEDPMAALIKACADHPDMMVKDAMHAMK